MIIRELLVNQEITLRILTLNHTQTIFDSINQNRVFLRKWLPFVDATKTANDTRAFVKSVVDDVEHRQEVFTVWYKKEFAGLLGLKDIDYLNRKLEIGFWLTEKMTGKGIMYLSVERLIDFVYSSLEMNRIVIRCGVGNNPSIAIPKRLGFSFEGIEKQGEKHHNKYIDLEVYSLLKRDWVQNH
ncbi:MAG: GNAT family N-acetyltransferase [Prolixibacteraceae bacterium]|nr:GNAT family N-acetyltransferase [Prolixibacteraceae bacterium]